MEFWEFNLKLLIVGQADELLVNKEIDAIADF